MPCAELIVEESYNTDVEAKFSKDYVPELARLGVGIRHIMHDDRRNALTMVLELPERADASLRQAVSDVLARFEMEACQLAVITDPSYRYAGEYDEESES